MLFLEVRKFPPDQRKATKKHQQVKFKYPPIAKYFSAATSNDERKPAASFDPSEIDFLAECALFSTCDPTVKFDIALVVGKRCQL